MVRLDLPFVKSERDRHGRIVYWYFRRNKRRWRLPGEPLSEEFMLAYYRLLTDGAAASLPPPPDRREYPRGTFGCLVNDYLGSGQFKAKLKPKTKGEYTRICEALQQGHGWKRVSHLKRRHVRQIRDEKADTPGAANNVLRMLKILLNFAVEDDLIEASPAAKFKELRVGEWRAWTDNECPGFEKRWAPGTMQRRAYVARALHRLAQAGSDHADRNHRRDGGITWCRARPARNCGSLSTAS